MIASVVAFLLSPWILFGLILLALVFEHNEAHGWTVFTTIVLAALAFFSFGLSWSQVGLAAVVWIPIGLVWSLWRWRKYCAHIVSEVKNGNLYASQGKDRIDPQEALGKITQWVIAWPFSLVESLLGDVIDAVQSIIKGVMKATYEKIAVKALVEIETHEQKK